ncbi:MAG: DUF1799 domain-containing protein [Gammaproteobacteria bacterium]|nr:DUF1799 domain-containing protein [Gammaproteobacteria bacterium]
MALKALADLGEEPEESDMPPLLEWEAPLWALYQTLKRQWRTGFEGATGLDFNVFLPVIEKRGWDVDLSLELLAVIEGAMLVQNG